MHGIYAELRVDRHKHGTSRKHWLVLVLECADQSHNVCRSLQVRVPCCVNAAQQSPVVFDQTSREKTADSQARHPIRGAKAHAHVIHKKRGHTKRVECLTAVCIFWLQVARDGFR